jgi:hypothetical protein
MMFRVGQVFYRVSLETIGESKILYVTHYYLDRADESGNALRFRELLWMDGQWQISPTDTVFGDGTEKDVLSFLVLKSGLAAKITELMEKHGL